MLITAFRKESANEARTAKRWMGKKLLTIVGER